MSKSELIFGLHTVEAVLQRQPERFIEIYALKGRQDDRLVNIINAGRQHGISVQFMARKALDNKAGDDRHQGIMARVTAAKQLSEDDLAAIISQRADSNKNAFILIFFIRSLQKCRNDYWAILFF